MPSPNTTATPRVTKDEQHLKRKFKAHTYRKALPLLIKDFDNRCAYSMRCMEHCAGESEIHVDHFYPKSEAGRNVHHYKNLMLASSHCNSKKHDKWPTKAAQREGIRFLNPCEEADYGVHIFEDRETGILYGTTPAGVYQIRVCDLNSEHLVKQRLARTNINTLTNKKIVFSSMDVVELLTAINEVKRLNIPEIPELPKNKQYLIDKY